VNARLLLMLGLIVILAFLIPLGDGKGSSSQGVSWSLSGRAAPLGSDLQLSAHTWKVQGVSSGGDYRLENLNAPLLTGNGCCCTYLPCISLNH
jgi:hypothetical protein